MEENFEFWNSSLVFEQQISKKKNLLFHNVCISIEAEFHGKSIDVHYLWVLLLGLSMDVN
jgi:hypothetical protein